MRRLPGGPHLAPRSGIKKTCERSLRIAHEIMTRHRALRTASGRRIAFYQPVGLHEPGTIVIADGKPYRSVADFFVQRHAREFAFGVEDIEVEIELGLPAAVEQAFFDRV